MSLLWSIAAIIAAAIPASIPSFLQRASQHRAEDALRKQYGDDAFDTKRPCAHCGTILERPPAEDINLRSIIIKANTDPFLLLEHIRAYLNLQTKGAERLSALLQDNEFEVQGRRVKLALIYLGDGEDKDAEVEPPAPFDDIAPPGDS